MGPSGDNCEVQCVRIDSKNIELTFTCGSSVSILELKGVCSE
jgi:hypothetical protein